MAKKKNLSDVQETFDSWFPNSGYKVSVYNGSNREGYLEDSLGRQYRFSRFSNLKQCKTLEGLRSYLSSTLGSQDSSGGIVNISITGDQNTTLHNSPHASVNPNPKTQVLQTKYEDLKSYLLSEGFRSQIPPEAQAVLLYALSGLDAALLEVIRG